MGKNILLAGANGFIGSTLLKFLSKKNFRIYALYRNKKNIPPKTMGVTYIICDISKYKILNTRLLRIKKIDIIINLAANLNSIDEIKYLNSFINDNIITQANLLKVASEKKCNLFIYTSSISVYDDFDNKNKPYKEKDILKPNSFYGWSKLKSEELLGIQSKISSFKGVSLRLSGVHDVSRKKGVVFKMFSNSFNNENLLINEPRSKFSIIFLEDVLKAIYLVIKNKRKIKNYECYNLSGDYVVSLKEIAEKIIKISGKGKIQIKHNMLKRYQVMNLKKIKNQLNFKTNNIEYYLKKYSYSFKENL